MKTLEEKMKYCEKRIYQKIEFLEDFLKNITQEISEKNAGLILKKFAKDYLVAFCEGKKNKNSVEIFIFDEEEDSSYEDVELKERIFGISFDLIGGKKRGIDNIRLSFLNAIKNKNYKKLGLIDRTL